MDPAQTPPFLFIYFKNPFPTSYSPQGNYVVAGRIRNMYYDLSICDYDYYTLLCENESEHYTFYYNVEDVTRGYTGDFSERVPDTFFTIVLRFWGIRINSELFVMHMRAAENTLPALRQLYSYWKHKGYTENDTHLIAAQMILKASYMFIAQSLKLQNLLRNRFVWNTNRNPAHFLQRPEVRNLIQPLHHQLLGFLLTPERIRRLGRRYLGQMVGFKGRQLDAVMKIVNC